MRNFYLFGFCSVLCFILSSFGARAGTVSPTPTPGLEISTPTCTCTPLVIANGDPDPPLAVPTAHEVGRALHIIHSAPEKRLVLEDGSRLWIEGATTRWSFRLWADVLLGSAILKAPLEAAKGEKALLEVIQKEGVQAMTLVVPVDDLKSMEMAKVKSGDYSVAGPHEALQGGNFPYVEFRLEDEALGRPNQDGVYPLKASGKLALAGVTKDIPLQAEAVFSGTQVEVRGSAQILLKDYKVAPRSDIWGPMKPPSVEVHFDVVFGPEKPTLPSFPK